VDAQGKGERKVMWYALHKGKCSQAVYGVNLQKAQQKRRASKGR